MLKKIILLGGKIDFELGVYGKSIHFLNVKDNYSPALNNPNEPKLKSAISESIYNQFTMGIKVNFSYLINKKDCLV